MKRKNKNFLHNKTVIITGASGGLGFSIAKYLIEKYNCKIIGIARNEQKILKAINTLGEYKSQFIYKIFDVSVYENWVSFVKYLNDEAIIPDVLINNAGFMLPFEKFELNDDIEIEKIIHTNFSAVIYSTKALIPLIKKSKTPAIINISSAAGLCPVAGQAMYCATKHAVRGFTETIQQEYNKKIYIGGVYPGFIKTDIMNNVNLSNKDKKIVEKLMMPLDKATKKIVKRITKKKKKTVIGFDGGYMNLFGRFFPKTTPTIITKVLKASKLEMFKNLTD